MDTRVDEIADGIYRLSTFVPDVGPTGFTFNQFLIDDEQPLLFHTGPAAMFPLVSEAIATVTPVEGLRWITFGHVEADECGSMNQFLAAAPNAEVAHGALGCMVSLNDICDRPPVPLDRWSGHRAGHPPGAPHRHAPRAPRLGSAGALRGDHQDAVLWRPVHHSSATVPRSRPTTSSRARRSAEDIFGATCITPQTGPTIRSLAELAPTTLAVMHGSSYAGDGAAALEALAANYDDRLEAARDVAAPGQRV